MSTQDPYSTPPPGGQPYGQPDPQPYQQPAEPGGGGPPHGAPSTPRNGLGIASLVLGVLALLTGLFFIGSLFGIAAIVLGVLHLGRARRREATSRGLGIAGIVLGALGILATVVVIGLGVSFFNSDEGQQLIDCLAQAGSDQAAQQQCRVQFDQTGG